MCLASGLEQKMKTILSLSFLVIAAASFAQPISVSNDLSQGSGGFFGGTPGTFQSNVSHSHTISGSSYSFNLRGDVTAQMTGTATDFLHQSSVYFTLTTGAAPVLLSNIAVDYNGKEVVSGGSTATFTATNFYRAMLYFGTFAPDAEYATYLTNRTVQGVYIEDLSNGIPNTILAANSAYTLYMDLYPILNISSYPSNSSMLGYSVEFGGTVSPQYDGLTMRFDAEAVPEPTTMTLLGLGAAAIAARKRRAKH